MKRPAPPQQMELLAWSPPAPLRRFEEHRVRAQTAGARIARAVAASLADCGHDRAEVARRMGEFLGHPVSLHMLNAYASPSRAEGTISLPRFIALLHATGDQRLLQVLAEPLGWAVVERRFVPLIDLAAVQERAEDLRRQADALRRRARAEGAL